MKKSNKATLVAAALVVTAATGLGTYASTDTNNKQTKTTLTQQLTDDQKAGLEQARELFKAGDKEGAKALLDQLDLDHLEWGHHFGMGHKEFMKNLTEEQKEGLKQVKELMKERKNDEAKALLDKLGLDLPPKFEMKLNLTEAQKAAFEKAKSLKQAGDEEGAKKVLEDAGLQLPLFHLEKSPLMENLTEAQKARLEEAKTLMKSGDKEGAKAIFNELGLTPPMKGFILNRPELTEEQKAGLEKVRELKEAGDQDGAKALMESLKLPKPKEHMMQWLKEGKDKDVEANS